MEPECTFRNQCSVSCFIRDQHATVFWAVGGKQEIGSIDSAQQMRALRRDRLRDRTSCAKQTTRDIGEKTKTKLKKKRFKNAVQNARGVYIFSAFAFRGCHSEFSRTSSSNCKDTTDDTLHRPVVADTCQLCPVNASARRIGTA